MDASAIQQFWDWFRARADMVRENPERHAPEISDMLGRLEGELGWEMGQPGRGAGWDFIVRSESPDYRIAAHEVIASAPAIEGWRFLEWRPPHGSRMVVKLGKGRPFRVDQVTATLHADPKYPVLNVALCSPEFTGRLTDEEKYSGYLMLDALLGEKTVEDSFDGIDFRAAPEGEVAAGRLAKELERRLRELRARPCAVSEDWAILNSEVEGLPMVACVATGPDLSKIPLHPWRLDAAIGLRKPDGSGFPSKEELAALQDLDERVKAWVAARTSAVPWMTRTTGGVRTTSIYVSEPKGLAGGLRAQIGEAGYASEVRIVYDSRWREYRRYVE